MKHQVAEKQAFIFTRDGFYPDYEAEADLQSSGTVSWTGGLCSSRQWKI